MSSNQSDGAQSITPMQSVHDQGKIRQPHPLQCPSLPTILPTFLPALPPKRPLILTSSVLSIVPPLYPLSTPVHRLFQRLPQEQIMAKILNSLMNLIHWAWHQAAGRCVSSGRSLWKGLSFVANPPPFKEGCIIWLSKGY
jgi:hypothetical protein